MEYDTHLQAIMQAAGQNSKPVFTLIAPNGQKGDHSGFFNVTLEFPPQYSGKKVQQDVVLFEVVEAVTPMICPASGWYTGITNDVMCDDTKKLWYANNTAYRGSHMQDPKSSSTADCSFTRNDEDDNSSQCELPIADAWYTDNSIQSAGQVYIKIQIDPYVAANFRLKELNIFATFTIYYWSDPNFTPST